MPKDLKKELESIPKYLLTHSDMHGLDGYPLIEPIKSDRFGTWVKYEDLENIIKKLKEA